MVAGTLLAIRERVEALASDGGSYGVVCARTGTHPVPAAGKRFADRERARLAAALTEEYRAALRRYDPQAPVYDVIVSDVGANRSLLRNTDDRGLSSASGADFESQSLWNRRAGSVSTASVDRGARPTGQPEAGPYSSLAEPVLQGARRPEDQPARGAYSHRLAAVVFEELSAGEYDGIETAVMETYMRLAEMVESPDELCLRLLEATALELDAALDGPEQTALVSGAAARLPGESTAVDPLATTLTRLRRAGLLGEYSVSPVEPSLPNRARSVEIQIADYALAPRKGRLPVLPVSIEAYRWRRTGHLAVEGVAAANEGWQLRVSAGSSVTPTSSTTAPIEGEG